MRNNKRLSVFLSLILRHKPEAAGITLDRDGYTDVQDLLDRVNRTGRKIDMKTLETIVSTDSKNRYIFNLDKTKIRANQGHSVNVDLGLKPQVPTSKLYHGTSDRNIDIIMKEGLSKMNRQYVHLSDNLDTATQVGKRHGNLILLEIDVTQMNLDGYKFYRSENNVWLTDNVPPKYLKEIKSNKIKGF